MSIVLVVGAGAGVDFGMPLGEGLQKAIAAASASETGDLHQLQLTDKVLLSTIKRMSGPNREAVYNAASRIHKGVLYRSSIDDFLDVHRDDQALVTCGKILIARCILQAESASNLATGREVTEDSWLRRLFRSVGRGPGLSSIEQSFQRLTFINFNYDRCIEHFLTRALAGLYNLSPAAAYEIVIKSVRILHPYGTVGALPNSRQRDGTAFGDYKQAPLEEIALGIKTYSEQLDENDELAMIRNAIVNAKTLIFLGMHFHDQNLKLLFGDGGSSAKPDDVFATAYGRSDDDQAILRSKILGKLHGDAMAYKVSHRCRIRNDLNCIGLFRHYELSLGIS